MAERLELPNLPEVYEVISKSRLSAEDVAFLVRFGKENPHFQSFLGHTLRLYEYHLYNQLHCCSPNWFYQYFRYFRRGRGKRFLYLLATDLKLNPVLEGMKSRRMLVGPVNGSRGLGYRTAVDVFYGTVLINCEMTRDSSSEFWSSLPSRYAQKPELIKMEKFVSRVVKLL